MKLRTSPSAASGVTPAGVSGTGGCFTRSVGPSDGGSNLGQRPLFGPGPRPYPGSTGTLGQEEGRGLASLNGDTELAKTDLLDNWWVRAEGTRMKDPRRINVTKLTVLGKDWEGYRQCAYFRPGHERGYVLAESVAGSRETFPTTREFDPGTRVVVLAPISRQPKDGGVAVEEKMQVAIGPNKTDYTLHFDDARMTGPNGQEIHASDFRNHMWVRAEGRVMDDSRRIQVDRLEVVASDDEGFRRISLFRSGEPYGTLITLDEGK